MLKLYKFRWDAGRMGSVHSTFLADSDFVEKCMGQHIDFGEILGKHSEITGTLTAEDLEVLTDDQEFLAKFKQILGGFSVGHNPLDYLPEEFDPEIED